ncbi:MFS transporter [Streptomyces albidoflavus]
MTVKKVALPAGFGRLWTAQTISSLGDGVSHAALPLIALTLTRDPMALAVVTAAGTLPWLLFGVLGGALVDRWDRRRTMWVADASRAALLAIPALAAVFDVLSIPLLAVVAFLLGLGGLFFDTAATAYLPDLLRRDPVLLERANSRLRGAQTVMSGFAGPPVGSALLALGRAVPLLADAVSFSLSALLVRSLPATPRSLPAARETLLRQARAGASYVFRDRLLLGLALRPAVGNIAFLAVETVLALFAHDRLGIGTYGFGLLLAAEAAGGLLGAGIASRLGRRLGTGTALTCTAAVEGVAILGLASAPDPYVAGLAPAVCGAGRGPRHRSGTSVVRERSPGERARHAIVMITPARGAPRADGGVTPRVRSPLPPPPRPGRSGQRCTGRARRPAPASLRGRGRCRAAGRSRSQSGHSYLQQTTPPPPSPPEQPPTETPTTPSHNPAQPHTPARPQSSPAGA